MENNTQNASLLSTFLKFVDEYTYLMDGERYHNVDHQKITNDELAFIFLDSDYNPS